MKRLTFAIAVLLIAGFVSAQEIQNFQRQVIVSPEIKDGQVTFRVMAPNAREVKLSGSWMADRANAPAMTKGENGVWSYAIQAPAPEIYTYNFVIDGVPKNDDANIMVQRDGRNLLSMLFIDGPLTANYREASKRGNVHAVWYDSPTIGLNRRMMVYTPYGYETSKEKYPVLYLFHGGGGDEEAWVSMGRTAQIMDNLIEQGKAKPMLVVMPNGNPGQQAAPTFSLPEKQFDRNDPATANIYIHSVAKDIIPYIEKNYRVKTDPGSRAVSGLSMGGGHTLALSNNYPGKFHYILPLSMGIREESPETDAQFKALKKAGYKLYWVACGDTDFVWESARALDAALTKNGLEHTFHVTDGGHTWANWRKYLNTFAPLLFK
jgi:enterochelin esterase family protein